MNIKPSDLVLVSCRVVAVIETLEGQEIRIQEAEKGKYYTPEMTVKSISVVQVTPEPKGLGAEEINLVDV